MPVKWMSALLLLQMTCYFRSGSCGKVLVWPLEYSHWMNLKTILDELVQRGHEVTVLRSSSSVFLDPKKASGLKYETFPTTTNNDKVEKFFTEWVNRWIYDVPKDSCWFESFPAKDWDPFFSEILGRPTTMVDTMKKAEMWLIRSYWDMEFPRPTLPNIEFVGGLHCKPAKPLPEEMEEFAQSSGEHGVVVFSLGSMIKNTTQERANTIASALAQIPQKVFWRYDGMKPDTLGPNTRIFKWIPQNDLLGHPKTRVFVTHGGANGIYESIHHGVPMVGIPMFAEQYDNIAHMVAKGAAASVDFHTMTSSDLLNALKEVINNPSYKKNVMWLSTIHHDQPMKPLDRAVFWVEFVMRHKGAKHLKPLAFNLTWYQYHSLDVIGFLLACVAATIFLTIKCCLFVYRFFVKKQKNKKE
ncbi:UDP-glucuronosyltransferase 2B7-like isoform X3 [Chionomys nivalis]|uniref:UDP-glucuronosyltransferase 2B7-like isoform X3 n=1 Tax=Chionomys nivalis TaxID=269649 RepID=UPI002592B7ED|nr:UDP-glucuronosyltransferase 2B7-like isoform X3 [Chionomys nivalis]